MKRFLSKRLLSILLAVVLVAVSVPTTVFLIFSADAEGDQAGTDTQATSAVNSTGDFVDADHTAFIENANALSNGINAYFDDANRQHFYVENDQMKLQYTLGSNDENGRQIGYLQNSKGASYLENTMDIFIDMKNNAGETVRFYSSESKSFTDAGVCMDHFGHYYYEVTFEDQDFLSNFVEDSTKKTISPSDLNGSRNQTSVTKNSDGSITVTINDPGTAAKDPYIYSVAFKDGSWWQNDYQYEADAYDYIKITMKSDVSAAANTTSTSGSMELFYVANGLSGPNQAYTKSFNYARDGKEHTYYIPMTAEDNYTGTVTRFRVDFSSNVGEKITISEFSAVNSTTDIPDSLTIKRYFGMYNDNKLSHKLQIAADNVAVTDIVTIGIETRVPASDVKQLVAYNQTTETTTKSMASGQTLDGLRYLALDTSAGVLGYILVEDGNDDALSLTYDGTDYIITQTRCPSSTLYTYETDEEGNETVVSSELVDGAIYPSAKWIDGTDGGSWITHVTGAQNNSNDFFMLNRLYVDENHTFDEFLKVADTEMNPLGEENFEIYFDESTLDSTPASKLYPDSEGADGYLKYDPFTGAHILQLAGDGFNNPQYQYPNRHWNIKFKVTGDELDRGDVYVWTYTDNGGCLECAAVLDENYMMLPVPIQVAKNFSEYRGERDIFNISDPTYSYAIIPVEVEAESEQTLNVVHIEQNWGNYPNKQISSIQFHCPYYHLSTGTTESNCIVPWYTTERSRGLTTLPDHRAASSPFWTNQPQHNSTGSHRWLYYTDNNGNTIASETVDVYIGAYGPIYADLTMKYISDDGAISVEYNHMEMPQTDENRAYYEMKYTVNKDISFTDFKNQFTFFSMTDGDSTGIFQRISYVDKNNDFKYVANNTTGTTIYELGDESPYFTMFDMDGYSSGVNFNADGTTSGYSNLSFMIKDYDLNLTDTSVTNFALINRENRVGLTFNKTALELKAGDTITINAIVMPWGSQELDDDQEYYANDGDPTTVDYDYDDVIYVNEKRETLLTSEGFIYEPAEAVDVLYVDANGTVSTTYTAGTTAYYKETYLDKNVRDVRYNSCRNPYAATAYDENTTVTEAPFLPIISSVDGARAAFTLTGGSNNMAVVTKGFAKLTVPVIEELVGGEWVTYDVASINTPDRYDYGYAYDGYSVVYDEASGKYSYAFIVDMTGVDERTFRVSAADDFTGWTAGVQYEKGAEVFYDADVLEEKITTRHNISNIVYFPESEADEDFVRVYSTEYTKNESFFAVKNSGEVTGKYAFLRYRIPAKYEASSIEMYSDTDDGTQESGDVFYPKAIGDGEWHTLVVDISTFGTEGFLPDEKNGDYYAKYLRIDLFSGDKTTEDYVDYAFMGFAKDLDTIAEFLGDDYVMLSEKVNGTTVAQKINVTDKNFFYGADDLNDKITSSSVDKTLTATETGMPYVNLKLAKGVSAPGEFYETLYTSQTACLRSGQYIGILYRSANFNQFQIYMQSNNATTNHLTQTCVSGTGEWEYMILDMSQGSDPDTYVDENGMKILRFDYSNGSSQVTDLDLDIAFVSMFDSVEAANASLAYYVEKYGVEHDCVTENGWEHISGEPKERKICDICGEVMAERNTGFYGFLKLNDGTNSVRAGCHNKIPTYDASSILVKYSDDNGYYVKFTGEWIAINGGVNKYVYKVNDGEWIAFADQPSRTTAWSSDYATAISNSGYEIDPETSYLNGLFDGNNLIVDLNSYLNEETVNITFGAVPAGNPEVTIALAQFNGIVIPDEYTEGLEFTLLDNGTYAVSGYTGADTEVVLPSNYLAKPVTAIADEAFADCAITSISISDSITDIGAGIFAGCASLTEITVSADNGAYVVVNNCIVTADGTTVVATCASSTIPESVTAIGDGAFKGSTLTSIAIPSGITEIGAEAFADSAITTITYSGKPSQFDAITKGTNWASGTTYTLVCADFDPDLGDLDVDGDVDADDITIMRNYIASKDPITGVSTDDLGEGAAYADINCDGDINSLDLIALRKIVEQ